MIDYYRITYTVYRDGVIKSKDCFYKLLIDEEIKNKEIKLTWKNLKEIYFKLGWFLPFNIWNFKKGRVISFFRLSLFDKTTWDIKEWKQKELNMIIKIEYTKEKVTLKELSNFDIKLVNQFLKEKNLDMIRV